MIWIGAKLLGLRNLAAKVPWWAWLALAVALIIAWHLLADQRALKQAYNAGYTAAEAHWKAEAEKARQAQVEANARPAIISKAIAEKSNVDAQAYYERGRAAGAAYAAAHRVPASGSTCRPADLPGADHAAAVDDGSGEAAGMVALSRADFDLLTDNSTRLAKVHQDAEALIAAGIATPPR